MGTHSLNLLGAQEVEKLVQVIENPQNYDIPAWMLNRCAAITSLHSFVSSVHVAIAAHFFFVARACRRKDYKTGKDLHNYTNKLDLQLREDLDR